MADGELEVLLARMGDPRARIALRDLLLARGAYWEGFIPPPLKRVTGGDVASQLSQVTAERDALRDAVTLRGAQIASQAEQIEALQSRCDAAERSCDALKPDLVTPQNTIAKAIEPPKPTQASREDASLRQKAKIDEKKLKPESDSENA